MLQNLERLFNAHVDIPGTPGGSADVEPRGSGDVEHQGRAYGCALFEVKCGRVKSRPRADNQLGSAQKRSGRRPECSEMPRSTTPGMLRTAQVGSRNAQKCVRTRPRGDSHPVPPVLCACGQVGARVFLLQRVCRWIDHGGAASLFSLECGTTTALSLSREEAKDGG